MKDLSDRILSWFDGEARALPWRVLPTRPESGLRRDPYAVAVSEFMLQQTQVVTVLAYYQPFMARFPSWQALAGSQETEVLKLWEGLGYYRRARQLRHLAQTLVEEFGGRLPKERQALLKLPGIGPYTAGALLAFAYDLPEPAVDGNVVRLISRFDASPHQQGDPKAQREVRERVLGLMPDQRPGDFSEALIELGATVCLRLSPACHACPINHQCQAFIQSRVDEFPIRAESLEKPVSQKTYLLYYDGRRIWCRRRPGGLLAGLYEFPALAGYYGEDRKGELEGALRQAYGLFGQEGSVGLRFVGRRRPVFSHRIWELALWEWKPASPGGSLVGDRPDGEEGDLEAFSPEELAELPFPAFLASWRDAFLAGLGDKKSPEL